MSPQEIIGAIATIFAVAGVILNNRKCIWCFALWGVSNALSAYLHYDAALWSLTVRDVIFLGLVADGAWRWRKKPPDRLEPARTPPSSDEQRE